MRIAIIGGAGKFGEHLGENLEDGNEIVISDSSLEAAREVAERHGWRYGESQDIVQEADTVIVSVPIAVTVDVIREIGPHLDDDTLLCDVTSVKKKPVEAMKQYSGEVVGMHPMYAPSNSIAGQKVVLCPEKGDRWKEMREFWEENGADVHVTDPESHDQAMSLVQGLMHFSELVVAETIRRSDMSGSDMSEYSSPVYQLITDLTARMLNQKPGLYGSIQSENPENEEVRDRFMEAAEDIREVIGTGDFDDKFEELGEEFDLERAQERTDKIIEFLSDEVR
ncbi:MAG: prephenate dehydrogenase/arogenate dehydrogenase family protein [Candidatus Nanohaloarchaea archaeon]